jgi:hypothetical protein
MEMKLGSTSRICCNTDPLPACPVRTVSFRLWSLVACWLQHSWTRSVVSACVSRWRELNFSILSKSVSPSIKASNCRVSFSSVHNYVIYCYCHVSGVPWLIIAGSGLYDWIYWRVLCTIFLNFKQIKRYRWFTRFTVRRYTRTKILILH